jgi:uncharacterized membrane protein AbrB (regulator of aidB expression)
MFELVFIVCSLLEGNNCQNPRHLNPMRLMEGTSIIGCMMATQIEGARLVNEHPNWIIVRAVCQPVGKFEL